MHLYSHYSFNIGQRYSTTFIATFFHQSGDLYGKILLLLLGYQASPWCVTHSYFYGFTAQLAWQAQVQFWARKPIRVELKAILDLSFVGQPQAMAVSQNMISGTTGNK